MNHHMTASYFDRPDLETVVENIYAEHTDYLRDFAVKMTLLSRKYLRDRVPFHFLPGSDPRVKRLDDLGKKEAELVESLRDGAFSEAKAEERYQASTEDILYLYEEAENLSLNAPHAVLPIATFYGADNAEVALRAFGDFEWENLPSLIILIRAASMMGAGKSFVKPSDIKEYARRSLDDHNL